ncbi:MAG: polyphosphate kinase 1, partial [Geodermatophilaceae bacterium]|nr:polyphosphate kinase 1 [Geodermatophilaceae bacterium]
PALGAERFARVKVPNNVPRFVPVIDDRTVLPLEELIAAQLPQLFPGMDVGEHHLFRVTRNADVEVEEDRDEDLLQALERELARRRFGPAVRLEVGEAMDQHMLDLLIRELDMDADDVLRVPGLIDLSSLWSLYDVEAPTLKDPPFVPATHPRLTEGETAKSVFATLREGDVLVHHPYDSFATSVQRFIEQAAADENVLAIKLTLYRTSGDSPIVAALAEAAAAGKQVVVLVEVKARFDEEANISWAKTLERAGCHVVYGLVGLKTHCKTALVVRREGGGLRRYCHIGTGNYNPKTARMYEDLGILTADPTVGADLTDLFNVLTGYSRQTAYRNLLVAPYGVRRGLLERIERETAHAREGQASGIDFKLNSLVDESIIDALYRASNAGVPVRLLIRGICTLRPGVPDLSDNIQVRSVVGRFLEHARTFCFHNGGESEWWIGSADLMHRNLDRRVEVLLRVGDAAAASHLTWMMDAAMAEDTSAWDLQPDAAWKHSGGGRDLQLLLMAQHKNRTD